MSERIDLSGEQVVAGNIQDHQQMYQIFYYPRERSLVDKIAIYFFLGNNYKKYATRSIYFSSIEQLKRIVIDIIGAYFYFLGQRIKPDIPVPEYRRIMLESLLYEIRKKQLEKWEGTG